DRHRAKAAATETSHTGNVIDRTRRGIFATRRSAFRRATPSRGDGDSTRSLCCRRSTYGEDTCGTATLRQCRQLVKKARLAEGSICSPPNVKGGTATDRDCLSYALSRVRVG